MMASVIVKVHGLRELGEAMRGLKQEVNLKIGRSATGQGAGVIRKRARTLAPVADEDYEVEGVKVKKGNVRDNIVAKRVKPSDTPYTSEHIVAVRGGRKHGFASRIGSLHEFGTVFMPAKSFMRRAFDEEKSAAVDKIKSALTKGIDKAVAKVGK